MAVTRLAIVRAAHLLLYVDILREIGAPVDRELGRSLLPSGIEAMPNAYVSIPVALDWLARCGRDASVMELAYLAARRTSPATLSGNVLTALLAAPTGITRLQALKRTAHLEDSALDLRVRREGTNVRVLCDLPDFRNHAFLGFGEWLNLQTIIALVRSTAGAAWSPAEITFVSASRPSDAALNDYGNSRILLGQPNSSILVAVEVLARSGPSPTLISSVEPPGEWDFVSSLRSTLRPYLGDGRLSLSLAAELARMSHRSLQRQLASYGRTYSDIVQEARFELARDLLAEPSFKIIDIAYEAGYDNPQHFSRAFRQFTGSTPSIYRRTIDA